MGWLRHPPGDPRSKRGVRTTPVVAAGRGGPGGCCAHVRALLPLRVLRHPGGADDPRVADRPRRRAPAAPSAAPPPAPALAAGTHRQGLEAMTLPIPDDARRVVIIGPGKIGSGYLAPLFAQAGWQVVFAARSPEVVARIAAAGHFDVRTTGEAAPQRVHAESVLIGSEEFDRAVAGAALVTTAVGMGGPRDVGVPLARALAARGPARPIDVWAVENADVGP